MSSLRDSDLQGIATFSLHPSVPWSFVSIFKKKTFYRFPTLSLTEAFQIHKHKHGIY